MGLYPFKYVYVPPYFVDRAWTRHALEIITRRGVKIGIPFKRKIGKMIHAPSSLFVSHWFKLVIYLRNNMYKYTYMYEYVSQMFYDKIRFTEEKSYDLE